MNGNDFSGDRRRHLNDCFIRFHFKNRLFHGDDIAFGDEHFDHVPGFDFFTQLRQSEFNRHIYYPPAYKIIGFRFSGSMSSSFIARETTSGLIFLSRARYDSIASAI